MHSTFYIKYRSHHAQQILISCPLIITPSSDLHHGRSGDNVRNDGARRSPHNPSHKIPGLLPLHLPSTSAAMRKVAERGVTIGSANCSSPILSERQSFKQPIWQTDQMFAGEAGCWAVIVLSTAFSKAGWIYSTLTTSRFTSETVGDDPTSLLLPEADEKTGKPKLYTTTLPAICDILSTTMLNFGLLFVAPSIYQMTRGSVVFFSALFSVWFLKHRIGKSKWFVLFLVILGVAVVSLAGALERDRAGETLPRSTLVTHARELSLDAARTSRSTYTSSNHALRTTIGVCIISIAQIFAAAQFVLEESIMSRYSIAPLELVGYEGVSGLVVTLSAQATAHFTYGSIRDGRESVFDMRADWYQIAHNPRVYTASILMMLATGLYNCLALTVTRSLSATHRTSIDAFRTLVIWIVGLGLRWESFKWLQLVGFSGLVVGNLLFNEVVRPPALRSVRFWSSEDGDEEREHGQM